jgi:hypothetical protein
MPKFAPGNTIGKNGRARGVRNRLASTVFADVLEFWNEPVKDGSAITKGKAALLNAWRERPHDFVKSVFTIMPKEFVVENIVTELADSELETMIDTLRRQRALDEKLNVH